LSHHPPSIPPLPADASPAHTATTATPIARPAFALRCPLTATSARPAYCAASAHSTRLAGVQGPSDSCPKTDNIIASLPVSTVFAYSTATSCSETLPRSTLLYYKARSQYIFGYASSPPVNHKLRSRQLPKHVRTQDGRFRCWPREPHQACGLDHWRSRYVSWDNRVRVID